MTQRNSLPDHDQLLRVSDWSMPQQLGDSVLLGNWFVFLKAEWLQRSGMEVALAATSIDSSHAKPAIVFRGKETLKLPGIQIDPKPLPPADLVAITCDKSLYRVGQDTVRLLLASPQRRNTTQKLRLTLNSNTYSEQQIQLDEYGLCLHAVRDLPEGEYTAGIADIEAAACRFEIAEYRLVPFNVELAEQQLSGTTLRYTLSVTTFNLPYSGPVEVELQERGQRVGKRTTLHCNSEGRCQGAVTLSGMGPYTLNVLAGERTATVVLKGSEQERRETLPINALGEEHQASLLPLPQANQCRGMYIARSGSNTEPFLVERVIGPEVDITARATSELVRVVVVDAVHGTSNEHIYERVNAGDHLRLPVPTPYGVVLVGAFIDGAAWEGWCAVLRPVELDLACMAPQEAKPGSRVTITLKTGIHDRVIPVQLIVKDQRLTAPSDPAVELAACIKKNLSTWREQAFTGKVERTLASAQASPFLPPPMFRMMAASSPMVPPSAPVATSAMPVARQARFGFASPVPRQAAALEALAQGVPGATTPAGTASSGKTAMPTTLAQVRLQFAEVVYNQLVQVQGEAHVEVTLGDSMTRYSIEAFALSAEPLDWQRAETTINAVQSVYGELTVSPFVRAGDPVMGRLDVGAASGSAMVEVQHNDTPVPLFYESGEAITAGLPIPSGSVLRFPLKPGTITAIVRDARKGGLDVSERYISEPGRLRHVTRSLRILTPGDEVTLRTEQALELRPLPGLERPFQLFVEEACQYPYGCVEQTSCKLLAMLTGYITNMGKTESASSYETAIIAWHKRLQSMYLPGSGFCLYPPTDSQSRKPDTHYAPLATKRLLAFPEADSAGIKQEALREILANIQLMAQDAAKYYKIEYPPKKIDDCYSAYLVVNAAKASAQDKERAINFVLKHLTMKDNQASVVVSPRDQAHRFYGAMVAQRAETAYAAAVLLQAGDLNRAIAATNYVTSQFNANGILYSTVDTAAGLALLLSLRKAGIATDATGGRVVLNGEEMTLQQAIQHEGKVESLRCLDGMVLAQVTKEIQEDWSTLKRELPVTVRLEKKGQAQQHFTVGDEIDLVIKVQNYEPGFIRSSVLAWISVAKMSCMCPWWRWGVQSCPLWGKKMNCVNGGVWTKIRG